MSFVLDDGPDDLAAADLPLHALVNGTDVDMVDLHHAGHATLHARLVWAMLLLMISSQVGLVYWRRASPRSFRRATLLGAWLAVPLVALFAHAFFLLLGLWILFTVIAARLVRRAMRVPLDRFTPRDVYSFFLAVFRLSQAIAGAGYVVLCVEFLMPSLVPFAGALAWLALQLIGYGLYFGLLTRDVAELCTDMMSLTLGYGSVPSRGRGKGKQADDDDAAADSALPRRALVSNVCGICALPLLPIRDAAAAATAADDDPIVTLTCQHRYHEACVRGWTLVGKKNTCPACGEKVQYEQLNVHPWQRTSELWATCLDAMGLIAVWNPLIILGVQALIWTFDR